MIRIAVCDDEAYVTGKIETALLSFASKILTDYTVEAFCSSEEFLRALICNEAYDLIFIDIEMGSISGIDITQHLRTVQNNFSTYIVFISSHEKYLPFLFDVTPSGFIKKPIVINDLFSKFSVLINRISQEKSSNFFSYNVGHELHKTYFSDIFYFESVKRLMKMVVQNDIILFYSTISSLVKQLNNNFIITHRSYIVNISHVTSLAKEYLVVTNGDKIPIGKKWRAEVHDKVTDYLGGIFL